MLTENYYITKSPLAALQSTVIKKKKKNSRKPNKIFWVGGKIVGR